MLAKPSTIRVINLVFQLIDIIETVYRGASKGRGLVVSPKGAFRNITETRSIVLTPSLRQTILLAIGTEQDLPRVCVSRIVFVDLNDSLCTLLFNFT